jgi:hypothetical protein
VKAKKASATLPTLSFESKICRKWSTYSVRWPCLGLIGKTVLFPVLYSSTYFVEVYEGMYLCIVDHHITDIHTSIICTYRYICKRLYIRPNLIKKPQVMHGLPIVTGTLPPAICKAWSLHTYVLPNQIKQYMRHIMNSATISAVQGGRFIEKHRSSSLGRP